MSILTLGYLKSELPKEPDLKTVGAKICIRFGMIEYQRKSISD